MVGSLNDFGQMCQFLRGYKHPLLQFMAAFEEDEESWHVPPQQVRQDLKIWAAVVDKALLSFPIPHRPSRAQVAELVFVSDAAGAQFCKVEGRFMQQGPYGDRGAASIGVEEDGEVWFCSSLT